MKNTFISESVIFISFFISASFGVFTLFPTSALAWAQIPPGLENPSSNVIFLPGIEGSRLYKPGLISENQLWEPNRNADVQKLFLDPNGQSLDQSVYTRDIINTTNISLGLFDTDIYQHFSDSMDQLVANHTINAWEAIPYDWRKDLNDLVMNGIKLQDRYVYLIPEIERMASSSKTGKVTIITHSNGGLLAKTLINALQAQGEAGLIDKLIMVAPPELGTPESLAALLHGDDQEIRKFGYTFMSKPTARSLSENMPTAYNLAPSKNYFDRVALPVIQFDPSVDNVDNFRTKYGNNIKNYSSLSDFLLAKKDQRPKPDAADTDSPNVLNQALINQAKATHNSIDNWLPPSGLQVTEVAGWGIPTTSGIEYTAKENCLIGQTVCPYTLDHDLLKTIDGDGTVVSPSVMSASSTKIYLNIHDYNQENGKNVGHSTIMEAEPMEELIGNIIKNTPNVLPVDFSTTKPSGGDISGFEIGVHSPVSIDAYDLSGNHTGLATNTDPTSDLELIEENIPNSRYEEVGEGKYINLPGGGYSLKITGLDLGSFTLEEKIKQGDVQMSDNVFNDIPVTPMTTAQLDIQEGSYASSTTPILSIDVDGDGVVDATTTSITEISPASYLLLIKKEIQGFSIADPLKTNILNKIDNILNLLSQGKVKNANKKIKAFNRNLEKKLNKHRGHHSNIPPEDISILTDLLTKLLNSLATP